MSADTHAAFSGWRPWLDPRGSSTGEPNHEPDIRLGALSDEGTRSVIVISAMPATTLTAIDMPSGYGPDEPSGYRNIVGFASDYGIQFRTFAPETRNSVVEQLNTKVSRAKVLLELWARQGKVNTSIAVRIAELIEAASAEYPDIEIPTDEALLSALHFFQSFGRRRIRPASIGLAPKGGIWAEWSDAGRRAAVEFKGDGSVNLAAIQPDADQPLRRSTFTTNCSWKAASREIGRGGRLGWLLAR